MTHDDQPTETDDAVVDALRDLIRRTLRMERRLKELLEDDGGGE